MHFLSSVGFMWRIPVDKPQTLESLVWLVIKIKISTKNERYSALYCLYGVGPLRILSINKELVHLTLFQNWGVLQMLVKCDWSRVWRLFLIKHILKITPNPKVYVNVAVSLKKRDWLSDFSFHIGIQD